MRRGELAAEAEPVVLRQLALGDRDEAREPCLGGEQIVEARVEPVIRDAEADREQVARAIVEEVVLEVRELAAAQRERAELAEPLGGELGRAGDRGVQGRLARGQGGQIEARGLAEGRAAVDLCYRRTA